MLKPGGGYIDLGVRALPGSFGGQVEYLHRLSDRWSAYAQASAGAVDFDDGLGWRPEWGASAGVRWRF